MSENAHLSDTVLEDILTEKGGCLARTVIVDLARRAGHGRATLDRARHAAHVRSEGRGFPRIAYWILPPAASGDGSS